MGILNARVLLLCVVYLWSDESEFMALFRGFNLWILVVDFNFSIAIFLSLPVDLICSQAHILTSWVFLWYQVTVNSSMSGVHQVRCSFVWRRKQCRPPKRRVFKKNVDDGQSAKNKEIVSVIGLRSVDILCSVRYKLNWVGWIGWWNLCLCVPMFLMVVSVPLKSGTRFLYYVHVQGHYCIFHMSLFASCRLSYAMHTSAHTPFGFHTACRAVYE